MKTVEIESWALRVIEQVERKVAVEDSRVELKAAWPKPDKTARRLAGHANAAFGEHILWLIGVDETNGVQGANYSDLSSWLPSVQACFESIMPSLHHVNVMCNAKTVAALCFETTRPPYVIKNPAFGQASGCAVEFEVPWRDATRVRSATRSDLIRLLIPLSRLPKIEVLDGEIRFIRSQGKNSPEHLEYQLRLYVTPTASETLTFPFHRCTAVLKLDGKVLSDHTEMKMDTPQGITDKQRRQWNSIAAGSNLLRSAVVEMRTTFSQIEATADEIVIRGAGKVVVNGSFEFVELGKSKTLELEITLCEACSDSRLSLQCELSRTDEEISNDVRVWTL